MALLAYQHCTCCGISMREVLSDEEMFNEMEPLFCMSIDVCVIGLLCAFHCDFDGTQTLLQFFDLTLLAVTALQDRRVSFAARDLSIEIVHLRYVTPGAIASPNLLMHFYSAVQIFVVNGKCQLHTCRPHDSLNDQPAKQYIYILQLIRLIYNTQ